MPALSSTSYGGYKYAELATTTAFPATDSPSLDFDFTTSHLKLQAVGGDVEVSYDGSTVHAKIYAAQLLVDFPAIAVGKLWVRATAGTLRVFAW